MLKENNKYQRNEVLPPVIVGTCLKENFFHVGGNRDKVITFINPTRKIAHLEQTT